MSRALQHISLVFGLAAVPILGEEVRVSPSSVLLDSPESAQQLLVTGKRDDGRPADLTRAVRYEVVDPEVAAVDARGSVAPRREGTTEIVIQHEGERLRIPVEVKGIKAPPPVSFEEQVLPILAKAQCSSGSCHGKAEGQNGFKLTVFGFDPALDYDAIVKDSRGRRISPAAPEQSLLLLKAAAVVPHGGGLRIEPASLPYRRLARWMSDGAPFAGAGRRVMAISVEPDQPVLSAGESQQLRVTATGSGGERWCITAEAEYQTSSTLIARVDHRGLVEAGSVPGEAAILIRYRDQLTVARITLPAPGPEFPRPPAANFVDGLVWDKLERLRIAPSDLAPDAAFLRRVHLDTIGTLPSVEEARRFLASSDPEKRRRLIDSLLERAEYADYWAMRWSDVLRVDTERLSAQGAAAVVRWLRRQFLENRPYDEFVREIITARGDTRAEGPAALYKVFDSPEVLTRSMSQLFLGVRIECAQCHHHPSEKWGQDDYYALAGFFTGLARKGLPTGAESILAAGGSELKHPKTGQAIPVRALGAASVDVSRVPDRRQLLAEWMTSPDNPYLARSIANRLWAHYFGRGLVEPIDDLRSTNPATTEPPLVDLSRHLRELKYDLKAFTRTLLNSRVYQLSSEPNESNASDEQAFSHASWKALPAEVLLDAICQTTEVPEKFPGWPEGYRAIQVWENRMPHYFFRIFGRPARASVCECERSAEPSISQALHLMNSPEIIAKIQSPGGRARRLADSSLTPREIVEELYLATLSRLPTDPEMARTLEEFALSDRRAAAEDILWALLNSKEFIYNH